MRFSKRKKKTFNCNSFKLISSVIYLQVVYLQIPGKQPRWTTKHTSILDKALQKFLQWTLPAKNYVILMMHILIIIYLRLKRKQKNKHPTLGYGRTDWNTLMNGFLLVAGIQTIFHSLLYHIRSQQRVSTIFECLNEIRKSLLVSTFLQSSNSFTLGLGASHAVPDAPARHLPRGNDFDTDSLRKRYLFAPIANGSGRYQAYVHWGTECGLQRNSWLVVSR